MVDVEKIMAVGGEVPMYVALLMEFVAVNVRENLNAPKV